MVAVLVVRGATGRLSGHPFCPGVGHFRQVQRKACEIVRTGDPARGFALLEIGADRERIPVPDCLPGNPARGDVGQDALIQV